MGMGDSVRAVRETGRRVDMVTIQEQEEHLEKIRKLAKQFAVDENQIIYPVPYPVYLTPDEIDIIKRALACHLVVITLDLKDRRGEETNGTTDENI